jgi:hypothetical protein
MPHIALYADPYVFIYRIWPYIWWFPYKKYRIHTVYIWCWPTLHMCTEGSQATVHLHKQAQVMSTATTTDSPHYWASSWSCLFNTSAASYINWVGQNHTFLGIYGIFGREITIHTVIYGVYIRFWPTLFMYDAVSLFVAKGKQKNTQSIKALPTSSKEKEPLQYQVS